MKLQNNLSIKNSMFIKHHASEFNEQQLEVLRKAIEHDVDVTQYADPKYDAYQLNNIFVGLLNGLDVTYYADPSFSSQQMSAILETIDSMFDFMYQSSDEEFEEIFCLFERYCAKMRQERAKRTAKK